MKERLSAIWESVKGFWGRTSKRMRIVYLSGAVIILGFSLAVVMLLNRTDYIVLYDNLSTGDTANVIASLQEMNVPYTLEGNRLMIHKDDELFTRMQLATRNFPNSGVNYDLFSQGSSITATQYERERWDLFQTQERIKAAIMTFPEVRDAIVTIAMPQRDNFVLSSDRTVPTAAVKIETAMGRTLSPQQIQGIINIVSASVPGLAEESITLVDQNGDLRHVLSGSHPSSSSKIALVEEINETIRRRVMSMLTPIHGDGNVAVAVNTVLDTDQKVTESNTYLPLDPENPQNNPLDYVEQAAEMQNTQGFAQGVPGANDNINVPQYAGMEADLEGANFYSIHNVYDYLVSSVKEQIVKEGLEITDMTVAVIVNAAQFPAGMRDQLIDTVSTAAGVTADKVSVQNYVFELPERPAQPPIPPDQLVWILSGIGLLAALIIATMLILATRKRKQRALAAAEAGAMSLIDEESTLLDLLNQQDEEFEPIAIPDTPEQKLKLQIKDLAQTDPEIVAQLIKTWLMGA